MIIAKLISAFVFVYALYFLSSMDNRKMLSERFWNLNIFARVPLAIFSVLAFCIFAGNF